MKTINRCESRDHQYTMPVICNTGSTELITCRDCGGYIAEYGLGDNPQSQLRRTRRAIKQHLAASGTIGNYQW